MGNWPQRWSTLNAKYLCGWYIFQFLLFVCFLVFVFNLQHVKVLLTPGCPRGDLYVPMWWNTLDFHVQVHAQSQLPMTHFVGSQQHMRPWQLNTMGSWGSRSSPILSCPQLWAIIDTCGASSTWAVNKGTPLFTCSWLPMPHFKLCSMDT